MAILIGLGVTIALLVAAVLNNIYIGFPLLAGYIYFAALSLQKGYGWARLGAMSREGAQKALIVIPILLLIGCLTAMWMGAGTVASFVYYCLRLISPPLFILIAFFATSAVSLLLGSALGTVGTIGVILMAMAKGGQVNTYIMAGAIISAAYVGDRCSPVSSALYLLSAVTETDVYRNIRMVLKTTVAPFLLTALFFLPLSLKNPLAASDTGLQQALAQNFRIGFLPFLPALILMVLCCFKGVKVKLSMLVSAVCACLIAVLEQGMNIPTLLSTLMWGFEPEVGSALAGIIHGGGLWGMLKTSFVLLAACALTAVLQGMEAMRGLDKLLARPCGRFKLYLKTTALGLAGIGCGCNQSIAIVICGQLLQKPYQMNGFSRDDLARDISYTVLPLASAIPWTVASMVPTTTLGVPPAAHLPYLFFPYLMALWYGMVHAARDAKIRQQGEKTAARAAK